MLCQICHMAEATVFLIENKSQMHATLHICETCAQKRHLEDTLAKPALLIQQLLDALNPLEMLGMKDAQELKCPSCGRTFETFKQVGVFGCAECYQTFESSLIPLLRQFHQAEEHTPHAAAPVLPRDVHPQEELALKLQAAVAEEQFELAAQLRDQLRGLEGKNPS